MVFLPLVYPELFERFHIVPPRGVLFYGPPGAFLSPTSLSGI
jgi:ATP-dependent 26S proteasome regulatory subunit